ncbi:MAG: hypothetical protein AAFW70_23425 [Cyanobacteria bacterium J06635_10]
MKIPPKFLSFVLASVLFFTTLIPSTAMADESSICQKSTSTSNATYCEEQQVFILSFLSNAVVDIADTQANLQNDFTEFLTSSISS